MAEGSELRLIPIGFPIEELNDCLEERMLKKFKKRYSGKIYLEEGRTISLARKWHRNIRDIEQEEFQTTAVISDYYCNNYHRLRKRILKKLKRRVIMLPYGSGWERLDKDQELHFGNLITRLGLSWEGLKVVSK